jgi:two-component system nitrate/nitrite response regulator NarL
MRQPTRIALADDHEVFTAGLRIVLDAHDDLEVDGVATDGAQVGTLLRNRPPDVLVLDVHMPGADPAEVIASCHAIAPNVRVLVLTADARPATAERVLHAGAETVLSKNGSVQELVTAIRGTPRARPATAVTLPASGDPAVDLMIATLSPRERDVLGCLVRGCSNPRIAGELGLSVNTVRKHVERILVKLDVHSKLEAAAFVARHGLADTG